MAHEHGSTHGLSFETWVSISNLLAYSSRMDTHTPSQRQPFPDESLTEAEYDRLEYLLDLGTGGNAMSLEEMDGFFAALLCGPETVPPSAYLDEIWGEDGAPFDLAELEEFVKLAMRHWNSIAKKLVSPDLVYMALLWTEEGEELPRGNEWAEGFMRGVELCRDAWREIFEDDDRFAMLLPILALAHEHDPDPEMRTWQTPPSNEVRENVVVGLSVATQKLYDYFLAQRMRGARADGYARPKIGRNDPCFCGSGKKYKRCCGDRLVH
jgi:uncharacterized protein